MVSRTHPGLIKRLFELEVPEIGSGVVEIKAAAREPGHRTKIAVWSNDPNVDPVGACVGARGSRVRMVTNELRGERVDVVPFSDDPVELIQNALAPARVREVRLDEETGTATVIVSDFQLSLAIGKEGQNARLAARLTGWRIDIKSETQLAEEEAGYGDQEWAEGEWVEDEKGDMVWKPAEGGEAMSAEEWSHQAEDPAEARPPDRRKPRLAAEPARRPAGPPRPAGRARSGMAAEPAVAEEAEAGGGRGHGGGRGIAPTRTCVGCRSARPADRLIRIVRRPDGALAVDRTAPGRGAWLCRESPECLERGRAPARLRAGVSCAGRAPRLEQLCAQMGGAWRSGAPDVRG